MYIFAIDDSLDTPTDAIDLVHIGNIDLMDHHPARRFWASAKSRGLFIDPFEDTRLYFRQVQELSRLSKSEQTPAAHNELSKILDLALERRSGLISFCA